MDITVFRFLQKLLCQSAKPIFASCAIVCLNHVWNEFLFANVFLESKKLMTIPIGLMTFKGDLRADYVTMLAGIIIASLPMIICSCVCPNSLFVVLQQELLKVDRSILKWKPSVMYRRFYSLSVLCLHL